MENGNMTKRRIVLPDGRYLIYYTFDYQDSPYAETRADAAKAKSRKPETPRDVSRRRKTGR